MRSSLRLVLLAALLGWPSLASAQTPSLLERATVGTLFASSSVSQIPVWITAACTTAHTCREANPVMARLIGEGPIRAITVKSAVSFGAHYLVWRAPRWSGPLRNKKVRFAVAGALLAINTFDAVRDIKTFRRLHRGSP